MRRDVTTRIFGLLLTGVAGVALWRSITGHIDWQVIKIAAPVSLVLVGVMGLALSRNRS